MNLYVVQYNKLYTIPNVLNRFVQLRFHINIIRECVGADSKWCSVIRLMNGSAAVLDNSRFVKPLGIAELSGYDKWTY